MQSQRTSQHGVRSFDAIRGAPVDLDEYPSCVVIPQIAFLAERVMKTYVSGRQEDAHEFLRFFIEALEASRLAEYKGQK